MRATNEGTQKSAQFGHFSNHPNGVLGAEGVHRAELDRAEHSWVLQLVVGGAGHAVAGGEVALVRLESQLVVEVQRHERDLRDL